MYLSVESDTLTPVPLTRNRYYELEKALSDIPPGSLFACFSRAASAAWCLRGVKTVVVDETVIATQASHPATVYIPRNPEPHGVLVFTTCIKLASSGRAIPIDFLPNAKDGRTGASHTPKGVVLHVVSVLRDLYSKKTTHMANFSHS